MIGRSTANPGLQEETNVTTGSAHTFEQSANGYDPSIGRVITENSNNYARVPAAAGLAVKASPGFLKSVICLVGGTLRVEDAIATGGTGFMGVAVTLTAGQVIEFNALMTTGIYFESSALGVFLAIYR
jgi:hypothetical protein